MKYDFNAFITKDETKTVPVTSTKEANTAKLPSKAHYKVYLDMCVNRRITPKVINLFTTKKLYEEIALVNAMPYKASPDQQEKIVELINEINTIVPDTYVPLSAEALENINSKSASGFITKLIAKRKEFNEFAPATEKQTEDIANYQHCPDIAWEDYGIELKVYIKQLSYWSTEYSVPEDLATRPFRTITRTELIEQIKAKVTQRQANGMMYKYGSIYYKWMKTRITNGQINRIRKLEEDMSDLGVPKQVEIAIDQEGNIHEFPYASSRERTFPDGYVSLPDSDLRQLSKEQATKLIYQMENEARDKELGRFGNIYDEIQQTFQEKVQEFSHETGLGVAHDQMTARAVEQRNLTDFVYRLGSNIGYVDEDLADQMKNYFALSEQTNKDKTEGRKDELSDELKQNIKSYMYQAIDYASMDTIEKSVAKLEGFAEESESLMDIVATLRTEISAHFDSSEGEIELQEVI